MPRQSHSRDARTLCRVRPCRRAALIIALAAIVAPVLFGARVESRAPTLFVRVIDSASKQPLVNAEVIDLASKLDRFTNESGEARIPCRRAAACIFVCGRSVFASPIVNWSATRSRSEVDTITFTLPRVTYVRPDVVTKATTHCVGDADAASQVLSIAVLDQLLVAMCWRSRGPVNGNWGMPDVAQMLLVWSVKYRKAAPSGDNHP